MTNEDKKTLRTGELYFHAHELSDAELVAIETLSGLRPFSSSPDNSDDETDPAPEDQLLMNFIENSVHYAARDGFDVQDSEAFANLASFAEYLLDAMSLMAKVDESELEKMLLAALMAKLSLDEAIYQGEPAQNVWLTRIEEAHDLYDRSVRRPANDN